VSAPDAAETVGPGTVPGVGTPGSLDPLTRSLLVGITALRWATLAWSAVTLGVQLERGVVDRAAVAVAVLAAAAAWTAAVTVTAAGSPRRLLGSRWIVTDIGVAIGVAAAGAVTLGDGAEQDLGSAWPLTAVLAAGVARGPVVGAVAGVVVGGANLAGDLIAGNGARWLGAAGTVVLLALGGAVAGWATQLLRDAESRVAEARARARVAATLHDGVLQTLAAVQRRSSDPDLVRLARAQELELRQFLAADTAGDPAHPADRLRHGTDLVSALRDRVRTAEDRHDLRCELVVVEPPAFDDPERVAALAGAVGEAVTNAAKHGGATTVTVCLDAVDGDAACTVKDDGTGFDPADVVEGLGWTVSIRGRIEPLGGRAELRGRPGRGAEVVLRIPTRPDRATMTGTGPS
jgi:signal transduction histidine kinase